MDSHREWATSEFGQVRVTDRRHRRRLIDLTARLAKNPNGTVARTYREPAERQAAYDLLSNRALRSTELVASMACATALRCRGLEFVFVAVDGTGVTLSDQSKTKPLGPIGNRQLPTRGLLAFDALAVAPNGTTLGVLDLRFWVRDVLETSLDRYDQRRSGVTEMRFWNAAIAASCEALASHAPNVRPWFVMDREADETRILDHVANAGASFTIRLRQDRVVERNGRRTKLLTELRATKPVARSVIELPRTPKRERRQAKVEIRATRVSVLLPDYGSHDRTERIELNVVEVLERSDRADRLQWVLLTNEPVDRLTDIERVVASYRTRWRVEDFHRTWKSGACGLEDIQLRTPGGIRKWAIMLAAVATRTERLKHLARTEPDTPATVELHEDEIAALILAKRRIKTRVESVPDGVPTIGTAVRWIAELGGWAAQYRKGAQPGSTTIARGLHDLAIWTDAYRTARKDVENEKKMR